MKQVVERERNVDRRSKGYSVLTSLAKKFNDYDSIYYILQNLNKEDKSHIVSLHLNAISWTKMKLSKNQDIVLGFTRRKESGVRHAAMRLLANFSVEQEKIEDHLIEVLESTKDPFDLVYSISTLRQIGASRCIEALKKVILQNKRTDILTTGINALGEIDGGNQVDFFINLLSQKKDSFVKASIVEQIIKFTPDKRAINLLFDRVKQILGKRRTINIQYGVNQKPELVHAIIYMMQYQEEDPRICKLFNWIVEVKLDFLDEVEKQWVLENVKCR